MATRFYQIDAFADRPFTGNPAAVCLLNEPASTSWMQQVAAEMNLSETAFVVREDDENWQLRWFTPTVEVPLCGHATLAAAHALWKSGDLALNVRVRFHTQSGLLTASRQGDWIEMIFPAAESEPHDEPAGLAEALDAKLIAISETKMGIPVWLAELESEAAVREVKPNFQKLAQVKHGGVIVTSQASTPDYDFVSRVFVPVAGIDEDPVTGSAHCCLAPYWAAKLGKQTLAGYQASKRGGVVKVTLEQDQAKLSGQAITVVQGKLL